MKDEFNGLAAYALKRISEVNLDIKANARDYLFNDLELSLIQPKPEEFIVEVNGNKRWGVFQPFSTSISTETVEGTSLKCCFNFREKRPDYERSLSQGMAITAFENHLKMTLSKAIKSHGCDPVEYLSKIYADPTKIIPISERITSQHIA